MQTGKWGMCVWNPTSHKLWSEVCVLAASRYCCSCVWSNEPIVTIACWPHGRLHECNTMPACPWPCAVWRRVAAMLQVEMCRQWPMVVCSWWRSRKQYDRNTGVVLSPLLVMTETGTREVRRFARRLKCNQRIGFWECCSGSTGLTHLVSFAVRTLSVLVSAA